MKKIISAVVFTLLCVSYLTAQEATYVRVFNLKQEYVFKQGFISNVLDSSITISRGKKDFVIPVSQINMLKLNKSAGQTILNTIIISALSGSYMGAIAGLTGAIYIADTRGEDVGIGAFFGFTLGAVAGVGIGITIVSLRKRPQFLIRGKQEKWLEVKNLLQKNYKVPVTSNHEISN